LKSYCTQNNGDCSTCSLVNYNRDCRNVPIWGGYRPGAGRKPSGVKRKPYCFRLTEEEHARVKVFIQKIKEESKMTHEQIWE